MTFNEKLDWFCTGALDALTTISETAIFYVSETTQTSLRVLCKSFLVEFEPQLDALAALETAFEIPGETRHKYSFYGGDFIRVWQQREPEYRRVYPWPGTDPGKLLHGMADLVFDIVREAGQRKGTINSVVGGEEDAPITFFMLYAWPNDLNRVAYLRNQKQETKLAGQTKVNGTVTRVSQ